MSSTRAKHWSWRQLDCSGSELLVLLAMSDNCGDDLICYAALATIGEMARKSERTVQRILEKLVELGKIAVVEKRPGDTTKYRLLIPETFGRETGEKRRHPRQNDGGRAAAPLEASNGATHDSMSGGTPDKMSGVEPTTERPGGTTNWRGTHDKMSYESSLNTSLSPSQTRAPARAGPGQSPARAGATISDAEIASLDSRAAAAGVPGRQQGETWKAYRMRIADGEVRRRYLANQATRIGITPPLPDESLPKAIARIEPEITRDLQARASALKSGAEVRH